jgi:membrane-bound serine protease (ClpP class)
MEPITLYLTLLLTGFILIGLEIIVPGGILGIFGCAAWLFAATVGWRNFSEPWNLISAFSLLLFGILTFIIWIKFFPKSRMGKTLSLQTNSANCKSHKTAELEIGTTGEAVSTLRPSGIAKFNGKRFDVMADGEWIEAGNAIKVSSTSGGNITVVKA